MPRLRRLLRAASCSLLLLTAAIYPLTWSRGIYLAQFPTKSPSATQRELSLWRGQLRATWVWLPGFNYKGEPLTTTLVLPARARMAALHNTPTWWWRHYWSAAGWSDLRIPLWPLIPLSAAAAFVLRPRRRRASDEFCRQCGYDLRATPNLPCPECGA
jgi:hypothetical protein